MATIVLVHGTWACAWVWRDVVPRLESAGHVVHALTLTGLGERVHLSTRSIGLDTHIDDVVNALVYRDLTDVVLVVLVGHSYGGMVITGVADRVPERIAHLVYLDALVPRDGESLLDHAAPQARADTLQRVADEGDGWLLPVGEGFREAAGKRVPHPFTTWTVKLILSGSLAERIRRTYVLFTADRDGPDGRRLGLMAESWARVQGDGWDVRELDTVHSVSADPQPKADVLLEILSSR